MKTTQLTLIILLLALMATVAHSATIPDATTIDVGRYYPLPR